MISYIYRERQRDRQRDKQTGRQREKERKTEREGEESGADKCPGSPDVGDEQLNYPQGEVDNFKVRFCC